MERIENGVYVSHFKKEANSSNTSYCYKVLNTNVIHTETKERMVLYQALYGDCQIYCRPYDMFMSEVDKTKYPDVWQKYRFTVIRDDKLLEECINVYCSISSKVS